ncbi:MAG: glycosyltransferase [Kiritimatiellae bacterium]|nr:glycosyltransferase [Kiritimatiellia bacterium]
MKKNDEPVSRIIAFTKDWEDVPPSTPHVLRHMARDLPVLWVNSIGTRKPSLHKPVHFRRVLRRLRAFLRPIEHKENRLWVLAPLVIPQARSSVARRLNVWFFWQTVQRGWKILGDAPLEIWCFVPNAVDLLPHPRKGIDAFVVYYCTDDWPRFPYLDQEWMAEREQVLLRRADVIFTPSKALKERFAVTVGEKVRYAPHGVEYEKFARALDPATRVPEEVAKLPRPVIGFYGNLYPWVDFKLVLELARCKPHWSFVLIGGIFADVSMFASTKNVHFLGRREHEELPAYCAGFDAAIIPYDMNDPRMQTVSPVKVRELLAAGVPIAAADIPELRGFHAAVVLCRSTADWLEALERLVRLDHRAEISQSVCTHSWVHRVAELRRIVEEVKTQRVRFLYPYELEEAPRGMEEKQKRKSK